MHASIACESYSHILPQKPLARLFVVPDLYVLYIRPHGAEDNPEAAGARENGADQNDVFRKGLFLQLLLAEAPREVQTLQTDRHERPDQPLAGVFEACILLFVMHAGA